MRIVDDVRALNIHDTDPLCILATSADSELAVQAVDRLALDLAHGPRTLRRPAATVVGGQVQLVIFVLEADRQLHPVRISVTGSGFLVVATESVLTAVRRQLSEGPGEVWPSVIGLLLHLAHATQDVLDDLVDDSHRLETQAAGFTSAPQRREMARLRNQLFEISEISEGQQRVLAPDEELGQFLDGHQRRMLKRSAHAFDAARSMATQLYARLGDVLTQQGTIVSERLTVVATVFLPLTLVTSFFGMNFTWMTDRIGSLPAFIALGVGIPVMGSLFTVALTRHITRSS